MRLNDPLQTYVAALLFWVEFHACMHGLQPNRTARAATYSVGTCKPLQPPSSRVEQLLSKISKASLCAFVSDKPVAYNVNNTNWNNYITFCPLVNGNWKIVRSVSSSEQYAPHRLHSRYFNKFLKMNKTRTFMHSLKEQIECIKNMLLPRKTDYYFKSYNVSNITSLVTYNVRDVNGPRYKKL